MLSKTLAVVYQLILLSLLLAIFGAVRSNNQPATQEDISSRVAVFKASCDVGSIYMISNPYTNTFSYMCTNLKKD